MAQPWPGAVLAALLLSLPLLAPPGGAALAPERLTAAEVAHVAWHGDAAGLRARLAPPAPRAADVLSFAASFQGREVAPLPDVPIATQRPLADAVAFAYATYDLPAPTPAQMMDMAAQEKLLGPGLDRAAARLLGALVAHAPLAGQASEAELRGSVQRIGQAADAVMDALLALPPPAARGSFLFQDPLGLVLVGDAGSNAYTGNHAGTPFILPSVNLLTIDLGGDDVYTNNAGGAFPLSLCVEYVKRVDPLGFEHTSYTVVPPRLDDPRLGLCGNGVAAAASIDLAGDDAYIADGTFGRLEHLAAQGSGIATGVGVLVDLGGDDRYVSTMEDVGVAHQAVQGSGGTHGIVGFGLLLDLGRGNDTYRAEQSTVYDDTQFSQQRAQGAGEGVLFDDGGDDTYTALQHGPANAWQMAQGNIGVLLDLGGDDRYAARQDAFSDSVQGAQADDGVLIDYAGDDVYEARQHCAPAACFWQNVQASAEAGGAGELLDLAGDDVYYASSDGEQHNQASGVLAPTVLADLAGNDRYIDVQQGSVQYAQGAGKGALSVLLDAQGDDQYLALHIGPGEQWAQGASGSTKDPLPGPVAVPFLLTSVASMLLDLGGDDTYQAWMDTPAQLQVVQGDARGAAGLLLDCGGSNSYSSPGAGQGAWARGTAGAGADCSQLQASLPLHP